MREGQGPAFSDPSLQTVRPLSPDACGFGRPGASLVAQMLKKPSAAQETQVWSLGEEDPLEEEMTTHSSVLAWRVPWTEEPGGLQSTESQRVG